jgi:hypothetical protein
LQRRIALVQQVVEALVGQGARHLVVEQIRQQEQRKLQVRVFVQPPVTAVFLQSP